MSDVSNIAAESVDLSAFYTQTPEEVNAVITFQEAIAASGFNQEDITYLSSPYVILKGDEKDRLLQTPFYIRAWRFAEDTETERPYVVAFVVTEGNDMFILTDGSTGIYEQLKKLTAKRLEEGHAAPVEHAMVVNGLRKSEYGLNAENKPAAKGEKVVGKATTYYLA